MTKIEHAATVTPDLQLKYLNPVALKQDLLPNVGKTVLVTIRKRMKNRSQEQNRYYRGVVLAMIAEHCGYRGADEIEGLHEVLKNKFLPKEGRLGIPKSTTKLDTAEMTEYIEQIRDWAAQELTLYIPNPTGE